MFDKLDTFFNIFIYIVALYLTTIKRSNPVNICGYIIIIAHLYKDFTKLKRWPKWCEFGGILIAITLLYQGIKINNKYVFIVGVFKVLAHIRQIIFNNNRYYYL
jgi:hypothetical protein